jgi:1-acyl-sn-glycerol-3-phosphate acyltransferase
VVGLLRSLRTWLFTAPLIALVTISMGTLSMITSLLDKTGNTQHRMARFWARLMLAIGFVRVETEGLEKLDPSKSYVLASNHTSYYETPAILANIPLQFRFFAKQGLFQIPFLGWHLERAGHFPVVRGNARASLKSMADGARQIRDRHISVLLFPEGGRSEKTLREFKEGAAYIAIKAGVPIVPVGIAGARRVLPMHSTQVIPGTIRLYVGDPIPTANLSLKDRGPLTQQVVECVAQMVGEPVPEKSEPEPSEL